ncbi:MAG: hypothetical protein A07HR60_02905 [uncultured archaeon A07HR60]|nr:MAG: hypothetical protein A07HR60_02905 [uncultured archaeon A07HR60]
MAWHGPACGVSADIHASHTLHRVRHTSHEPQPRPRWFRSECLRGHGNGLLSHDKILALKRGEDVNRWPTDSHRERHGSLEHSAISCAMIGKQRSYFHE